MGGVLRQLPKAITDIRVKLFNSDTDKRLQEEEEQWDRPARPSQLVGMCLAEG